MTEVPRFDSGVFLPVLERIRSSPLSGEWKTMQSKKRTLIWAGVAVVALATAGTVTAVTIANAEAEETARQCAVATELSTVAIDNANVVADASRDALGAVQTVDLPETEGWTSSPYADRVGAEANAATDTTSEVPARASAAELIASVADGLAEMEKLWSPITCTDREQAADITEAAEAFDAASAKLNEEVATLTADFAAFQEDEKVRIAAELEAARIAAQQEAARLAAEEAERQRAAEEAARQQSTQRSTTNSGTNGGSSGNSNGSNGGSKPSGPPPGGQVGNGAPSGPICDNGMGGTRPC